jgi:hypothetical protein
MDPGSVTEEDLKRANIVLIDQTLADWADAGNFPLPNRPRTGSALAEVFRSNLQDRPVPFVLYSKDLDTLPGGWPQERREYVLSRLSNLDWVFQKSANSADLESISIQVSELANAAEQLGDWKLERPREEEMARFLGLSSEAPWIDSAWDGIRDAYPPLHEVTQQRHTTVILRWLLHRILPYPTFLIDDRQLAASLSVQADSILGKALPEKLNVLLQGAEYKGACSKFLGRRWWRAGVEEAIWQGTSGKPFDREALADLLGAEQAALRLDESIVAPVVTYGTDLRPENALVDISKTVRIQPDDWPAFADLPRSRAALVTENDELRNLVIRADLEGLS